MCGAISLSAVYRLASTPRQFPAHPCGRTRSRKSSRAAEAGASKPRTKDARQLLRDGHQNIELRRAVFEILTRASCDSFISLPRPIPSPVLEQLYCPPDALILSHHMGGTAANDVSGRSLRLGEISRSDVAQSGDTQAMSGRVRSSLRKLYSSLQHAAFPDSATMSARPGGNGTLKISSLRQSKYSAHERGRKAESPDRASPIARQRSDASAR